VGLTTLRIQAVTGTKGTHGRGGFVTGWIGQGRVHLLPVEQPYSGYLIAAW
jgi:hypothetical protein